MIITTIEQQRRVGKAARKVGGYRELISLSLQRRKNMVGPFNSQAERDEAAEQAASIDPRTGRTIGNHGTVEQALEFALDHLDNCAMEADTFLRSWREGSLDDWPEFYEWLAKDDAEEAEINASIKPEFIPVSLTLVQHTCETFARYANNHYAKGTPEGDEKARANEDMAEQWGTAMLAGIKATW